MDGINRTSLAFKVVGPADIKPVRAGVTELPLDEAHNYRNVSIETSVADFHSGAESPGYDRKTVINGENGVYFRAGSGKRYGTKQKLCFQKEDSGKDILSGTAE